MDELQNFAAMRSALSGDFGDRDALEPSMTPTSIADVDEAQVAPKQLHEETWLRLRSTCP